MTDRSAPERVSRRTLAGGVAVVGIGIPLLSACGDDGGGSAADKAADTPDAGGATPSASTSAQPGDSASPAGGGGGLASTSDIEVGGGKIFADEKVVITQPSEGEFKAFDVTCTHQGCPVTAVTDGVILCTCHGSKFSIETGEPEAGPAEAPLGEVQITVAGDQISLA